MADKEKALPEPFSAYFLNFPTPAMSKDPHKGYSKAQPQHNPPLKKD